MCIRDRHKVELNIDHVTPRSLHGTNFTNNLTLTCKRCNSKKDSIHPYYNVEGKQLRGTIVPNNFILIDDDDMRDEWVDFIFHKQDK